MGRKRSPGLVLRGKTWHIDKRIKGYGRLSESCGTGNLQEAERYLTHRLEELRLATVYGVRPTRTFKEAATKYLEENQHKRSIGRDAQDLMTIDPYIGELPLQRVHDGTLAGFVQARLKQGIANGTINRTLAVVRRVLNLAARRWRDASGLTWLQEAPLITMLQDEDARQPYPLSWAEQRLLFSHLPAHLARMALFKVNTGTREQEVVQLRWEWEVSIPELETSVFVVPKAIVKNKLDRLIVLNDVAQSVIDDVRGDHPTRVLTYKGRPVTRIYNSAWKRARKEAAGAYQNVIGEPCPDGFRRIRVHDLKHTFGRRLRAAGVSFEDRQDLLGHKSSRITTHYSAAELGSLRAAANKACSEKSRKTPAMTLIRSRGSIASA